MGIEGEFTRKSNLEFAGDTAVFTAFDGFAGVPEKFTVRHPGRGLWWREDEACQDARAWAIVVDAVPAFVEELFARPVSRSRHGRVSLAAADGFSVEMIDGHASYSYMEKFRLA
jgi:hypothetical protein